MGKPMKKDSYSFINVMAVLACVGVVVVILTVLFANHLFGKASPASSEPAESSRDGISSPPVSSGGTETSEDVSPSGEEPGKSEQPVNEYKYITLPRSDIHRGNLIVVNNSTPYDFTQSTPTESIYENRTGNYKLIDGSLRISPAALGSLNEMLDALYDSVGLTSLTLTSAYRDKATQEELYQSGKDQAKGDGSDQNTALSFRCMIYPQSDGSLTSGKFLWLRENCKSYGFILRFPEGKSSLTGFDSSSSVFRYVGQPHAYLIALNDYCLEEYIEFCGRFSFENRYTFEYGGVGYSIYFCPASEGDTTFKVPADRDYTVSGDNISGFIVTVTEG